MTKEQALTIIKLLSAIESWAFSVETSMPDYLHENLSIIVDECSKVLLSEEADSGSST